MVQPAWLLCDERGHELKRAYKIVRPDGYTIPAGVARIHGITAARAMRFLI